MSIVEVIIECVITNKQFAISISILNTKIEVATGRSIVVGNIQINEKLEVLSKCSDSITWLSLWSNDGIDVCRNRYWLGRCI